VNAAVSFHQICVLVVLVFLVWRVLRTEDHLQDLERRLQGRSIDA